MQAPALNSQEIIYISQNGTFFLHEIALNIYQLYFVFFIQFVL